MKKLTSIILILFLSLLSSPSWSDTLTFNKLGLGFGIGSPTPPNSIISEKECLEVISNGNVIYSDTKDVELDNSQRKFALLLFTFIFRFPNCPLFNSLPVFL